MPRWRGYEHHNKHSQTHEIFAIAIVRRRRIEFRAETGSKTKVDDGLKHLA